MPTPPAPSCAPHGTCAPRPRRPLVAGALVALCLGLAAHGGKAQDAAPAGEVLRLATRTDVKVPVYAVWRPDAQATVVLFSGGAGGYGPLGENGWPGGGNFLIRTGQRWASHPLNVVMVGRPSDGIDLSSGRVRRGEQHAADNRAILHAIKTKSDAPIWLIGTSMGTISATAASIADDGLIAGLVLTSSIVAYKVDGAIPTLALEKIRVPALIVHHANDACWACRPYEVKALAAAMKNAPRRATLFIEGGGLPQGAPCEAFHHHGFIGQENAVVDQIAAWILQPAP